MVDYFNENGFVVPEDILPEGCNTHFKNFEREIDQYLKEYYYGFRIKK
jgi:hypothetical protein